MLARPARARASSPWAASREASTTPTAAAAMPASWSVPGCSPDASPTITGTAEPVAEIGATMLMVPIASAR